MIDWTVPVWIPADWPEGQAWPDVTITLPVCDDDGRVVGRAVEWEYRFRDDPDGSAAIHFGARYYNEAMGYTDFADRFMRVECFRAAEMLYLHAAEHGNTLGFLDLGYVYYYDRCEGRYCYNMIPAAYGGRFADDVTREDRAYECLKVAAEAGDAQGCYKFGDVCREGMGCEPDASEAARWYMRAVELGRRDDPCIWGSAALRLAGAYENGVGVGQSFKEALRWYEQAQTGLDIAVRKGDTWYERSLATAKSGVARMRQEIRGGY